MGVIQSSLALPSGVATTIHNASTDAAALDVTLTNRSGRPVRARLALAAGASPGAADWIEHDAGLRSGIPLVNFAIVVPNGLRLVALVDGADCMAEVHGETIVNATAFAHRASLTAGVDTTLLTQASDAAPRAYHVNLVNRGLRPATARIAVSATGTPTDAEWVEIGTVLPGLPLRRWPLLIPASKRLVVRTDGSAVSAVAWGRAYGVPIV